MSKKALILLGGFRLGDCFHCIPILTMIKEQGYDDVLWVSGTYEESVVKFLSDYYGFSYVIHDDGIPQDIHSREQFFKAYSRNYDYNDYDFVFDKYRQSFEFEPIDELKKYAYLWNHKRDNIKNKVVVQPDTTSNFKRVPSVYEVDYFRRFNEVVSIGGKTDTLIEQSKKIQGASWKEVFEEIKDAKLFVGLHSAVMCFAFYTGIPMVILFFWENLFSFKKFRPNIIELLKPNKVQLEQAIDSLNNEDAKINKISYKGNCDLCGRYGDLYEIWIKSGVFHKGRVRACLLCSKDYKDGSPKEVEIEEELERELEWLRTTVPSEVAIEIIKFKREIELLRGKKK